MSGNEEEVMEYEGDGSAPPYRPAVNPPRAASAVTTTKRSMPNTLDPGQTTSAAATARNLPTDTVPAVVSGAPASLSVAASTSAVASTSAAAAAGNSTSSEASAQLRAHVRQFPKGYSGTMEVWIRSVDGLKLPCVTIQQLLNTQFKSIASIIPDRNKISVIFGDRNEANYLVREQIFTGAVISIPSKCIVDVDGAIRADDLVGLDHLNDLVVNGVGLFGSTDLRPCRILNAVAVTRTNDSGVRVWTNTVKITFEGNLVPKYVAIDKLRIPTRLFHKKPMFCDKCQTHGHTAKFCRRQTICARCNCNHSTADCSNPAVNKSLCPRCAKQHSDSRSSCSYFQQVAKDFKTAQLTSSNQRYKQELMRLREQNGDVTHPRQAPALDHVNFPPLSNSYASLDNVEPDDDIEPGPAHNGPVPHPFPPPPKNPYAARPRSRSSKRRRDGSFSVNRQPEGELVDRKPAANRYRSPQQLQATSRTASSVSRPATRREQHTNDRRKPQSSALRLLIITFARSLGLSEAWLAILEAIVDPLLGALLPHSDAIMAAVTPLMSNIH